MPRCVSTLDIGRVVDGGRVCLPIGAVEDLVQVLPTLLTIVFFGEGAVVNQPNTGAMLPDLADVALDEEACKIVGHDRREDGFNVVAVPGCLLEILGGRRPGVVFVAADAADGLVVLLDVVVVEHFDFAYDDRREVLVVVLDRVGSSASAARGRRGGVVGDGKVVGRLRRKRRGRCGFLGRPCLVKGLVGAVDAARDAGGGRGWS